MNEFLIKEKSVLTAAMFKAVKDLEATLVVATCEGEATVARLGATFNGDCNVNIIE